MSEMRDSLLDTADEDKDYITLLPHVTDEHRWMVAIFRHQRDGEYLPTKTSRMMKRLQAERLAGAWSALYRLEIRL